MNNITIETLTPVHVGSGRVLQKNMDFIFFSNLSQKPIAILDEEKIFNLLGRERLNQWMKAIEEKADLLPMLRQQKPKLSPHDIHHRITCTRETNILKGELYEHIHNASSKPYLPGSSLKGAIRTAVLTTLIYNEKSFVQNKNNLGFYNSRDKRFEYKDKNIINHFVADDAANRQQNKDFFRLLHIGDAVFQRTEAIMINTYSLRHDRWEKRTDLSQWTECIPKGEKSSLRINFREQTLMTHKNQEVQNKIIAFIGKNNAYLQADKLFQTINQHTIRLLKREIDFIEEQEDDALYNYADRLNEILKTAQQCNPASCVLRLGKHSGYSFMTGGWQEELLDKNVFTEIKRAARRKSGYENFPLPKTRRFTGNGSPVGFVKLILSESPNENHSDCNPWLSRYSVG